MEPRASVPVLIFAVRGKMKPANFKASCYKKRSTRRNGEQFTIGMFYSVSFIVDTFSNVNLITKRYPRHGYTKSIKLLFDVSMPQGLHLRKKDLQLT
ncbi:hypothetical protein TPHV1_80040 [Treponema phagedenis]|uniref:Uncharacterized protein n=1 Tax=Treponema phagedenis TaxID=162 RepID=A0A0B7H060_TREPH|nr:hypothetical protein TPHV1_80040 [Treponema phagedenis]